MRKLDSITYNAKKINHYKKERTIEEPKYSYVANIEVERSYPCRKSNWDTKERLVNE